MSKKEKGKAAAAPKANAAAKSPGRDPVWDPGKMPNKADLKAHVKKFNAQEGRKSKASLAKYAAENGLNAEAISAMAGETVEKEIDLETAGALRRAAMRAINGGAKVKRKEKAEPKAEPKAKAKKAKGKKAKDEDDE